jgi:hypothetical protein
MVFAVTIQASIEISGAVGGSKTPNAVEKLAFIQ